MNRRLVIGAVAAFAVIFNLGYLFHEVVAADLFKASLGPGVQREQYLIPVIALAFAIHVVLLALAFPVARHYFVGKRGWSNLATGAVLGLFGGFWWDALQGGLIEFATYNVALPGMLLDSAYHTVEGVLAGSIIGAVYREPAVVVGRV